jgi:hypothetical protein
VIENTGITASDTVIPAHAPDDLLNLTRIRRASGMSPL